MQRRRGFLASLFDFDVCVLFVRQLGEEPLDGVVLSFSCGNLDIRWETDSRVCGSDAVHYRVASTSASKMRCSSRVRIGILLRFPRGSFESSWRGHGSWLI